MLTELPIPVPLFLASVFVLSLVLTGLIRRWALRAMLDVPNERSSHSTPTPRGGGLAIVVAFTGALIVLTIVGIVPVRTLIALLGGLPVAWIGFLDDQQSVSWKTRAAVHFLSAVWAVAWMGGMPMLNLGGMVLDWGIVGHAVGIIGIVWMINLYNFMDGIDGIAGGEAVFAALAGGIIGALALAGVSENDAASIALIGLSLGMASLGFLLWNWHPARIFMGDVGSGFLGFTFGAFAIISVGVTPLDAAPRISLWVWLILLGVFIVDATLTLIRRVLRRERWYQPHRLHAYQKLVIRWRNHARVTTAVLFVNVGWLLPMAALATIYPVYGVHFTLVALLPLILLAVFLKAGLREETA